jgi:glycosyltransferase involved in cell wall biosynthesis
MRDFFNKWFFFKNKVYISKKPESFGGGSNSFTQLFVNKAKLNGLKVVNNISKAQKAVIIANLGEVKDLIEARKRGCYIIHRLDEDFAYLEGENRSAKHQKIIELNKYSDLTVFQSKFVFDNIYPYIKPQNYKIIYNGSDPQLFYPKPQIEKKYIGHVSWSTGEKKRFDLLYDFIKSYPQEKFLLVGRHQETKYNFELPNVKILGPVNRNKIASVFDEMKMLYFPSERDPCPNTVIESLLSGVPVCYNPIGGTVELVKDCGLPLTQVNELLNNLPDFQKKCLTREDLHFDKVFHEYMK